MTWDKTVRIRTSLSKILFKTLGKCKLNHDGACQRQNCDRMQWQAQRQGSTVSNCVRAGMQIFTQPQDVERIICNCEGTGEEWGDDGRLRSDSIDRCHQEDIVC